jgi:hypothetical protein
MVSSPRKTPGSSEPQRVRSHVPDHVRHAPAQVTAAPGTLPAGKACDTEPTAEAALDYGLSQRALIDVSGRTGDVAE